MEEKGIRQGATCAKALWQAVVRFAEEQGKAGRAREWRVPGTAGDARLRGGGAGGHVEGAGLGPRSTGRLLRALAGTSQGPPYGVTLSSVRSA